MIAVKTLPLFRLSVGLLRGVEYIVPPVQLSSDAPAELCLWLDRARSELRLFWALGESENPIDPECRWTVWWWWWCWRWMCRLFREGDINAASFTKMDPCSSWPVSCTTKMHISHISTISSTQYNSRNNAIIVYTPALHFLWDRIAC